MLAAHSPFSGDQAPKSHRRPLQPRNQLTAPINVAQQKPYKEFPISVVGKENIPPSYSSSTPVIKEECLHAASIDPSLADELTVVREKLARLRVEEERNEEVLRKKGLLLDSEMKEILNRGEMQKQLELEVDRLYRLKEIKLACMRVSPFKSLRDKEQEKKIKQDQLHKSYVYIQGCEIA